LEEAPATAVGTTLTEYEGAVLKDLLVSVKAGIRPYTEASLGICPKHTDPKKKRECEQAPVLEAGELAPGDHILFSEWAVPNVGEKGTWKLKLETECTTTYVGKDGSESTSNRTSSKDYELVYAGTTRGYRLSPLRRITSPSPHGRVHCTYKLTNPHGNGDKVYEGSWSLPEAITE
jgi:hypothetical protein